MADGWRNPGSRGGRGHLYPVAPPPVRLAGFAVGVKTLAAVVVVCLVAASGCLVEAWRSTTGDRHLAPFQASYVPPMPVAPRPVAPQPVAARPVPTKRPP